jgi:hypothetical protein
MKTKSILTFIKSKSGNNRKQENISFPPATRNSSAWSYSYDLNVNKRLEEVLKQNITKLNDAESELENLVSSQSKTNITDPNEDQV